MSGGGGAPVSIPLRDDTQLSVTPSGIQLGARFFDLANIQDARQVAPDPVTFALRVAGVGLVEFQPIHPGDGDIVLGALFRYRPDLRPAGFAGPTGAAGYPPPTPYPPTTGYPPMGYAPMGYPPPAAPRVMYGQSPNVQQGELTPYPRTFGELLGAIFQLYGKHFRKWLALGILVAIIPAFLGGVLQVAIYLAIGFNPWGSNADLFPPSTLQTTQPGTLPTLPIHFPGADQLKIIVIVAGVAFILSIFFGAWQIAALSIAAREAILRRGVRIGDSLSGGLGRLFPVLGTSILLGLISSASFIPAFAVIILLSTFPNSVSAATLVACGDFLLLIGSVILVLFFAIRLGFAPYVAASDRLGPGTSLASSWRLTHGAWWRTFGIIFILYVVVIFASIVVGQIQIVSVAVSLLVATPILQALAAPLFALGWMVMWYDRRLRREGYAAVTQTGAAPAATGSFGPPYEPPAAQG